MRLLLQDVCLLNVGVARRIERDRNVVVAVEIKYDMAEHFELLANLLISVDVIESRQDLIDRPKFGFTHLGDQSVQAVHRTANRDQ